MSIHFTQICAFIAYSFVFMSYYLWFIVAKIDNFSNQSALGCFLLPKITAIAVPATNLSGSPWRRHQRSGIAG